MGKSGPLDDPNSNPKFLSEAKQSMGDLPCKICKLGYGAVSDPGYSLIFHDAWFTKSWYLQGFVKT